jgi:hypothetical protein
MLVARIDKERGVRTAGLYVAIIAFVAVSLLVWTEFSQLAAVGGQFRLRLIELSP